MRRRLFLGAATATAAVTPPAAHADDAALLDLERRKNLPLADPSWCDGEQTDALSDELLTVSGELEDEITASPSRSLVSAAIRLRIVLDSDVGLSGRLRTDDDMLNIRAAYDAIMAAVGPTAEPLHPARPLWPTPDGAQP